MLIVLKMKNLNPRQQKLYDQFQNENEANLRGIIGDKQPRHEGRIIAEMVLKEREEEKSKRDRNSSYKWYQKPIGIFAIGVVTGVTVLVIGYFIAPLFAQTP